MKKIMFNDRYGLTEAVLSGRKTQTRRLISHSILDKVDRFRVEYFENTLDTLSEIEAFNHFFNVEQVEKRPFTIGEIVAVAQAYKDFGAYCIDSRAMTNKMFVKAEYMPHQIRITNVRVERLQDISDDDCIKELGLDYVSRNIGYGNAMSEWVYQFRWDDKIGRTQDYSHKNPKEVFATMIDKICGRGTWENNPFVFVYDFELVK